MPDPVITYECPIASVKHDLPGDHVRLMRTGDGGFVVACDCGPEALADADTTPHPTADHLVNIYGGDPSPEEWLRLERAAEGWYDTTAWHSPEDAEGTWGQRRARFRDRVEDIADTHDGRVLEETAADRRHRAVECPSCGAGEGQKCKRPSGHSVRKAHAERVALVDESDIGEERPATQADLSGWA